MTIQTVINKNDPAEPILIERQFSNSDTDPLRETLFDGELADVPGYLRRMDVKSLDWSVGHSCHSIDVLIPGRPGDGLPDQMQQEYESHE